MLFVSQKIERMKSELHLLDAEGKQPNKHTFFFDTKKEGKVVASFLAQTADLHLGISASSSSFH